MKPKYPKATIIIGDSRRIDELNDETVHLIITSPPYWQLKDYGNGSQIGFNDSYEDYILMPKEWIINQANMRWGLNRKKVIDNPEVIEEIQQEIKRLTNA